MVPFRLGIEPFGLLVGVEDGIVGNDTTIDQRNGLAALLVQDRGGGEIGRGCGGRTCGNANRYMSGSVTRDDIGAVVPIVVGDDHRRCQGFSDLDIVEDIVQQLVEREVVVLLGEELVDHVQLEQRLAAWKYDASVFQVDIDDPLDVRSGVEREPQATFRTTFGCLVL